MKIEIFLTPDTIPPDWPNKKSTAVVIDVLRASTTICTALVNGAETILPIAEIEKARAYHAEHPDSLLCGERDGRMIAGFHLGNSPAEYTPEAVKGRTLIHCSTNGTKMIERGREAKELIVCGFVNLDCCVDFLKNHEEIGILCSGKLGRFSIEDAACAGALMERLGTAPEDDPAHTVTGLWRLFDRGPVSIVKASEHGRYLASIGFAQDLILAGGENVCPVLPRLRAGSLGL